MTREQMKKFLELVDSGASLKAYSRLLGLDKNAYQYHLTRLHYYRSLVEEEASKEVEEVDEPKIVVEDSEELEEEDEKPAYRFTALVDEEKVLEALEDEGDDE